MFKLKKYCALCVCLVFVINLFVSLEVQAVSKSEAIEFYNYFSSAINESNISNIKYYFLFFSENEIIENFRFANVTYPKTSAYFYIAKGYQKIGELENAYKYYFQAINSINTLKNASREFKSLLL